MYKMLCVFVCLCVGIAEETNISNSLITRANELKQELAELVNTWGACQIHTLMGALPPLTDTDKTLTPYHNAP